LGLYLGLLDRKLRYFKVSGELVPTSEEAALAAQEMANQERQRANQLAQRLRELGIDPDEI
jgi:hypothetical protein